MLDWHTCTGRFLPQTHLSFTQLFIRNVLAPGPMRNWKMHTTCVALTQDQKGPDRAAGRVVAFMYQVFFSFKNVQLQKNGMTWRLLRSNKPVYAPKATRLVTSCCGLEWRRGRVSRGRPLRSEGPSPAVPSSCPAGTCGRTTWRERTVGVRVRTCSRKLKIQILTGSNWLHWIIFQKFFSEFI